MELKKIVNNNKFINGFSIAAMVIMLAAFFSTLIFEEDRINLFFSSDTLYLPSIYRDLFVDKNDIDGWHFNPAPNFFPDMIFYFLLMFITNNFIVSTFVFSVVQYVLLGFLLTRIFKFVFPSRSGYYHIVIYGLLTFILLERFYYTRDLTYAFNILINSYHTGAFVMTLICFLLTLKFFRNKKPVHILLLFILATLSVLSDRLFIVLFAVPICITSLLLYRNTGIKNILALIVTNGIAIVTGQSLFKLIDKDNSGLVGLSGNKVTVEIIKAQFHDFYAQITDYLSYSGFRSLSISLFLFSFLLVVYLFFASRNGDNKTLTFVSLFSVIFSIFVICTPMLSGKYEGWDCLRYNIYPFLLAGLNFTLFTAYKVKNKPLKEGGKFVLLASNTILLCTAIYQFNLEGFKGYFNYYPENARLIDSYAEKENLKYGVANYWEAKKISMFSKKNVKVYSVFDDVSFYDHVTNSDWFFKNKFDFVLFTRFSDTTLYRKNLKNIRYISNIPACRLVKINPFTYHEMTGSAVVNIE